MSSAFVYTDYDSKWSDILHLAVHGLWLLSSNFITLWHKCSQPPLADCATDVEQCCRLPRAHSVLLFKDTQQRTPRGRQIYGSNEYALCFSKFHTTESKQTLRLGNRATHAHTQVHWNTLFGLLCRAHVYRCAVSSVASCIDLLYGHMVLHRVWLDSAFLFDLSWVTLIQQNTGAFMFGSCYLFEWSLQCWQQWSSAEEKVGEASWG